MNVKEKTGKLEIQVAEMRKDVEYLKKGMDNVNSQVEKLDSKIDKLAIDLPKMFTDLIRNYVTKEEFNSLKETVDHVKAKSTQNENKINKFTIIWSAVVAAVTFLLAFGEQIAEWLTKLVHTQG